MAVAQVHRRSSNDVLLGQSEVDRLWGAVGSLFEASREDRRIHSEGARAAQEQFGTHSIQALDVFSEVTSQAHEDRQRDREMLGGIINRLGDFGSGMVGAVSSITAENRSTINAVVDGSNAALREMSSLLEQCLETHAEMGEIALRQMETQQKGAQREVEGLKERIAFLEGLLNEAERRWLEEGLSICQLASELPPERVLQALKERGRFYRDRLDRIDRAEREKLRKKEQIEAEKRRRIEEESQKVREAESALVMKARSDRILQSRNRQIKMARVSLEASYASLQDGRDWVRAACLISIIVLPIFSYKCSDERGLLTFPLTALSWIGAFLVLRSCNQEDVKKKWVGFYLKALDRLAADEKLTVRQAVRAQLGDDRTISPETLASEEVQRALGRVGDVLVEGNPDEENSTIPAALRSLVEHAEQPPSTFIDIPKY